MNVSLENLGGPFFCLRVYLPWGYSIPSLVWFEQLLDPIKFLYFWKENKRISRYFRLKYELFSMKVRRAIFLSQTLPTLGILHTKFGLIWTTSWPNKEDLFLKFLIWKKSQISVRETNFFPRQPIKKYFLLYTFITLVILHTRFGSLWTTSWPDKISIFLKI